MKRRELLGSLVAIALPASGCLSATESTRPETTRTTETESTRPETTRTTETELPAGTGLSITADSDPGHAFTIDAALVDGFDADSPATVRIALTNTGERRTLFFGLPPFDPVSAASGGARLFLLTPGELTVSPMGGRNYIPKLPIDGCWKAMHVPSFSDTGGEHTLESGETITREYYVLGSPENQACIPNGEYRFECSYRISSSPEPVVKFKWGFTLAVDN